MLNQPLAENTAPVIAIIGLITKAFFQLFSAPPSTQTQPSFDLGSFLIGVLAIIGTIVTVLGLLASIYFYYRTMGMAVKIDNKPEQSIDPTILVLDIYRCPLEKKLWEEYRKQNKKFLRRYRFSNIFLVRIMIVVTLILAFLINYLIYFNSFLAYEPIFRIFVQIVYSLFPLVFIVMTPVGVKRYQRFQMIVQKLGASPEKASWWIMDHAEMAVCAEYNYLLLKAHWVLKQIRAEVIAVKSDSIEGIVFSRLSFRVMKATITPDPDEKDTFTISVEIPGDFNLRGQLTKGEFINRFLDLMVSGGLDLKNQKSPLS